VGLDVYVGSLTRYYSHDWETVVQRAGREQGIPVVTQRNNQPADEIRDPAIIRDHILAWRSAISRALREAGLTDGELEWVEDREAPYFADKPGWDCYGALQLLAAYEERGKPLFGPTFPSQLRRDWPKDSVLKSQVMNRSKPRYAHLYACDIWLPIEIKDLFGGPSPAAGTVRMGSVFGLLRDLEALNKRTYGGNEDDRKTWSAQMPDRSDRSFERNAKFALAIMLELSAAAARERLPMLLDY
jgi:hypothetical protein